MSNKWAQVSVGLGIVASCILWPGLVAWMAGSASVICLLLIGCGRFFWRWFPEHEPLPAEATLEEIEEVVNQGR